MKTENIKIKANLNHKPITEISFHCQKKKKKPDKIKNKKSSRNVDFVFFFGQILSLHLTVFLFLFCRDSINTIILKKSSGKMFKILKCSRIQGSMD